MQARSLLFNRIVKTLMVKAGSRGSSDVYIRIGNTGLGLILLGIGIWWAARNLLGVGPWFTGALWAALTVTAAVMYLNSRRTRWLTAAYLAAAVTAYEVLDITLGGVLPGSLVLVFLGAGFAAVYQFATRPANWPLVAGAFVAAIGVASLLLSIAFMQARYVIPAVLVIWGVYTLWTNMRGGGGKGHGGGAGDVPEAQWHYLNEHNDQNRDDT